MVIQREIDSFFGWLTRGSEAWHEAAIVQFAATTTAVALLGVLVGFLVQLVRHGPLKAGEMTVGTLRTGAVELARTSWRRVHALARLAAQESLRRRVWVTLLVFLVVLAFAGWYLSTEHQEPGKLYLSVVLTATSFMSLLVALLISTLSLPAEFKSKTIYTVVTKPVRAGDIVLGRIVGFTAIGTALLAFMGAASYAFVTLSLDHTHVIDPGTLREQRGVGGELIGYAARTDSVMGHSHEVSLNPAGAGVAFAAHGHEHTVLPGEGTPTSGPQKLLRARTPKRGTLRFIDRNGVPKPRGISVGNEWTYRSFIDGGTQAAAVWTFAGVDESVLAGRGEAAVLPIELVVDVFRSYKGQIDRPIRGSIQLRNPKTGQASSLRTFEAKDGEADLFEFPVAQTGAGGAPLDLLDDLVSDAGELDVIVQCQERAMYYGFAQADCYIRLPEDSVAWNFVKGLLSIWVQMVVVIAIGVAASTFLNGPIAVLFTASFVLLGFYRDFLIGIATGVQPDGTKVYGGGPIEALVRICTQMNLVSDFNRGDIGEPDQRAIAVNLMKGADLVVQKAIEALVYVLPDFRTLSSVDYVAEGFSIPAAVVGRELAIAAAYVLGLSVAGYFFLRCREVAKA